MHDMAKIYLKNNSTYKEVSSLRTKDSGAWSSKLTVSQIFKKISGVWTTGATSTGVSAYSFGGFIETTPEATGGTLTIGGAWDVSATTCQYIANYGSADVTNSATWSITSGGTYASINSSGLLTVNSSANNSNVTIQCVYQGQTVTLNVKVTYVSGASSQTTTSTTTDESGNTVNTTTTTTTNGTGTTTQTTTIVTDSNGDPIHKENESIDTQGNVNTQEIAYDNNGNEVVTGYTIDTSGNQSGGETLSNGLDTGVLIFDGHDWTATLKATILFSNITPESTQFPLMNASSRGDDNKLDGAFFLVTRKTSGMGRDVYDENGTQQSNTTSSDPTLKWRIQSYLGGSLQTGIDFYYNNGTRPYDTNKFGSKTATLTLVYKMIYTESNHQLMTEIYKPDGTTIISKPRSETPITFTRTMSDVTFEIGKATNVSGTELKTTLEVLDFNVQKTL